MTHHSSTLRRLALAAGSYLLLTAGACGGDKSTAPAARVVSVKLTVVPTNPRVGEHTDIGAVGVDAGGVTIQGVTCTYVSSNAAVLALTQQGPDAVGLGVSAGSATVTATCGSKQGSMTLTVRPALVTFTVTKAGAGSGSVFLNPAGGTYDVGTSVTATATALTGSTFAGWSGTCTGTNAACTRTLLTNETATATFTLNETFVGTPVPNTAMGEVTTSAGCRFAVSTSGSLSAIVITNADGTLGGTTSGAATTSIVVTFTPAFTSCIASPYSNNFSGTVSGTGTAVVAVAANSPTGGQRFTFNGTRSGNTLTGSLTILTTVLADGTTSIPLTKVIAGYTLTKQ